jgi:hypothetical protein
VIAAKEMSHLLDDMYERHEHNKTQGSSKTAPGLHLLGIGTENDTKPHRLCSMNCSSAERNDQLADTKY